MTVEQRAIYDYKKGNVSAEICADVLLESLNITHPTLHMLLCDECVDEDIIKIAAEVLNYQDTAPSGVCPNCGSTGYDAAHTNLAECKKCGTFFKLKKHNEV